MCLDLDIYLTQTCLIVVVKPFARRLRMCAPNGVVNIARKRTTKISVH